MLYSEIGNQVLKFGLGVLAILVIGIVLAIIGIQHEHLTKLRDRKAELEIMIKDDEKKIKELEKQVKYLKEENKELEKEVLLLDPKRKKIEKKKKTKQVGKDNTNTE